MATKKDGRTTDERKWPSLKYLEDYKTWQVDSRVGVGGDRGGKREVFPTREEANARRAQLRAERDQSGVEAIEIDTPLRVEAVACARRLSAVGKTLTEATDFYLNDLAKRSKSLPWTKFYDDYMKLVEASTLGLAHQADTRLRVGYFRDYAGDRLVRDITADEITEWLNSMRVTKPGHERHGKPYTEISKRKIRTLLVTAYNFALKKGYAAENPAVEVFGGHANRAPKRDKASAQPVKPVTLAKRPDQILFPEEFEALLRAAEDCIRACLVVQGFCGVRPDEAQRLSWQDLTTTGRNWLLTVPANVAKNGILRTIPIRAAARKWLEPYSDRFGSNTYLCDGAYREPFDRARAVARARLQDAGAKRTMSRWPNDAIRHSFASMYLPAKVGDLTELVREMGHENASLISSTYAQVEGVTPAVAKAWWAITP